MGSCIRLRNSILIACSFRTIRFLIVLRPMTKEPHLRDRVQQCVAGTRWEDGRTPPRFSRAIPYFPGLYGTALDGDARIPKPGRRCLPYPLSSRRRKAPRGVCRFAESAVGFNGLP